MHITRTSELSLHMFVWLLSFVQGQALSPVQLRAGAPCQVLEVGERQLFTVCSVAVSSHFESIVLLMLLN